ncbi:MAG TPA: malto-oligosyltrehalose trehalohydrolase [Acidobacteriaceae bacterium]|nr:malto-oligosyltrehalose trehalohydrolase [Acidobacteriaceae bacterium]
MPELDGVPTVKPLPIGAMPQENGTHFRVWAPLAGSVDVVAEGGGSRHPLEREEEGYFSGLLDGFAPGDRYRFSLDSGEPFPDPASRYQPEGPHGPSAIVDPCAYSWSSSEANWPGVSIDGQVLYEMHIGTFTPRGSFLSAIDEFPRLRNLGITLLECMPLAEFAGNPGWGYDGVDLFAPFHCYGRPEDLRRMIDAAHQAGLGIILDVVYNHLGPDGNYLEKYSGHYFSKAKTDWGRAINFDGEQSRPVRNFFLANVAHWIAEYHFDGLRLDATQSIRDDGSHGTHIVAEIGACVRSSAAGRTTVVLAENEPQDSRLLAPIDENGYGLDAVWNDDFHHSAVVAATGRREAYFRDHLGRPQEFISAAKYGFLYQGQYYSWQSAPRGTSSLHVEPKAFITFLENHDQVANFGRAQRLRLLSSPARYRALTALWLLGPGTPMFFQGQEYGAETPFHYFAGHTGELARQVVQGRHEFMLQFASQDTPEMRAVFSNPEDAETFLQSRLDPAEQQRCPEIIALHTDLLALRRTDPVLRRSGDTIGSIRSIDGAVLGESCFVIRYLTGRREDRLLLVNLGSGLDLPHLPEPLVAPPAGCDWHLQWSSEWPKYGGCGSSAPGRFGAWHVTGECTQLLIPGQASGPLRPEEPKSGLGG